MFQHLSATTEEHKPGHECGWPWRFWTHSGFCPWTCLYQIASLLQNVLKQSLHLNTSKCVNVFSEAEGNKLCASLSAMSRRCVEEWRFRSTHSYELGGGDWWASFYAVLPPEGIPVDKTVGMGRHDAEYWAGSRCMISFSNDHFIHVVSCKFCQQKGGEKWQVLITRKVETYLKPAEQNLRSLCLRWRPDFQVLNVLIVGGKGGGEGWREAARLLVLAPWLRGRRR
jgi:hypothetical protein